MNNRSIREEYFIWLYNKIDNKHTSFRFLCKKLHATPFIPRISNDENRTSDALELRTLFIGDHSLDELHTEVQYFVKGDCTVFEMLIALSDRMNYLTNESKGPPYWFHQLLSNLRLNDQFSDSRLIGNIGEGFTNTAESSIEFVLERLMNRTYDYYGNGSLFPLKRRPPKDMREVEIWYQLMLYLDENYGMG
jgi:hypothetical protein